MTTLFKSVLGAFVAVFATITAFAATVVTTEADLKTALAAGGEVALGADIEVKEEIKISSGVTAVLDLNGKKITSGYQTGSTSKHIYPFNNYGTFTIKDLAGEGSITGRGIFVQDGSKLTIESGAVYAIDSNGGSVLFQYGGDIVINGGHIEQKAEGTYNFAINGLGGTVTVNNGWVGGNHGAIAAGGAVVVLNGGTFVCTGTAGMSDNVLYSYDSGSIVINGGTFIADNDGPAGGCCIYDTNGKVTVNGGSFSNSSGGDVWGTTGTTIKGGTFENLIETKHVVVGATIINAGKAYTKTEDGLSEISGVARIGAQGYATFEEAIAAAKSGDMVTLLTDVALLKSILLPAEKALTIDGNGHKLTAADDFTSDGNSAAMVLAYGDRGYSQNSKYEVKNLTFEGFNGLSRVLRANFCDAVVENCTFKNNEVVGGVVTSADAALTVSGCTFNGNTVSGEAGYGVIDIGSDVGNGTTLKAVIENNKFVGNKVEYAVLFLFTSADVSGNYFNGNEHTGINGNAAAILAGPYTGNMEYAINVTDNAFDSAISKSGVALPAVFAEDWSSLGATTKFDLSSNYWNGGKPDYETSGANPLVTVEDYCTTYDAETGKLGGLVAISTYIAKIGDTNYETLADAFAEAKDGDTITLLGDCELVSGIDIDKNITVDGAGYKVYAADIADDTEMFNIRSKVTIINLTFDADHKFSYGIQVQDAADVTLSDVSILYAGNDNWGASVNLNGGKLFVSGNFTAFSGGENGGAFPFTGILYWDGDFKFADGVTASIADPTGATADSDLLLVGTVGLLSIEDADAFLSQFNIPSGFAPYTLALDADIVSSFGGFTGASPLPWNTIIDYGKQILDAIGESTTETQVTVGLLDDTVIPDVFVYEDANFSINGNGKTLTGTIDVTDNVGTISNVVLTSGTTFVMTNVTTGCVKFGDNVTISSPVTIVPPANYGVGSLPLIEFTDGSGVKPEDFVIDQSAVEIPEGTEFVVDGNKIVLGTPVAKIGEVKYASLVGAIAAAKSGDTVTLLGDCGITTGIILDKNITIDGGNFTLTAVSGDGSLAQMVKIESAATIKNITLAVNHKYDYGIQMNNPASDLTLENVTILYAGKAEGHKNDELLFGASVFLQQGNLLVKGKFTAFSGGETAGTFPFTGILYWPAGDNAPTFMFDTGATASISDPTGATSDSDLLLVGAPGILSVEDADAMLSAFNIPAGFAPYTLKLDCPIVQGVGGGFTGASPLAWNTIIDYGKKILTVVNESTTETQVEVGILDDVKIPEVFVYEDANFSINGNGKVLSGTIDFTDNVGTISNVVLTSDMTFVMTNVTEGCVKLGEGVIITEPVKVIPPDNFGRGEDSATLIEFAEGSGLSLENFEIDTSTVQLPEGSQIVQDGNKIILKLPIAQVGNRKFATLSEAFEAANDGDTVRVLYSFNTNETIVINKAVTFDFSDDVITNTASGAAIQVAAVGVKFIGGELVAKDDGIEVVEGGSAVIERGVYEVTGDALAGAVTVSGGTFNKASDVINAFKSDDCEAVDNGDGWCTVMDYVAQFGEAKYVSLQDAIDAAVATNPTVDNPATVTLLGNVAGSVTLPENVIISANGYTVQSVVDSVGHIVELHGGAYQAGKHPEQPPIRSIKIEGNTVKLSFVPRQILKTVVVEASSDLKTWTAMDDITYVNDGPGKECVISVAKPQGNNAFFRVKFEYAD